jgi:phage shock protein PspC (stress-responsive transcriptional regulator)
MSNYQSYPPPTQQPKRPLTRSHDNKIVAGVCGGFAEYTGLDVNLVRIVLVAATVFGLGSPILVYLVGWVLMPEQQPTYAAAFRDTSTESARP